MERPVAQGGVSRRSLASGGLTFTVAGREDDADIRRLLRENELGGWVRLSLERTPDAFAADFGLSRSHAFIVARDGSTGEAVGVCEHAVRDAFVGGAVRPLPYLGALRVARAYRHRLHVLRSGFEAVRTLLAEPGDLPALTSITAGNTIAQRVLCAGLPGMPLYRCCGELSTFALRTAARPVPPGVERATRQDLAAIAVLLQRVYCQHEFAPVWRTADLERLLAVGGLRIGDLLVVRRGPGVRGCLAVWDQGAAKQTVVRGYGTGLGAIRPLLNLVSRFTATPRMPPVGAPLRQVYLSHVAVEENDEAVFRALLTAGLTLARQRGFDMALTGFASAHPFADVVQRSRALRYRSELYRVHWRDTAPSSDAAAARVPHPEIAIM
jgi:hypothetical protein